METTTRYVTRVESGGNGAIVRVAIYARLSRDPSELSANTSIQVVECLEEVKHYAQERGLRVEVVVIFEENDISASKYSKKERPDFRGLIELVKENKVDAIFATEVERLVRQPAEAEQLIDLADTTDLREVHLTSEEGYNLSTPNGVYRLRQAVNLAERESRKTSERLRRKLADRARNGQTHGSRRCFGYKAGNMEIDEAEASILREMGSKLLAGCSFKEIAYWANEQGYKTAEGKMWYPVTIRNSLRRVRYAGIREHQGKRYRATWPPVFDAATWEQMQLKITLSADRFAGRRKARKYLLTGRVYCGKCGSSLNGETKRDQPGRPLRPVYHCRVQGDTQREHGCGGVTINADALNWYVRESVFYQLDPEKVVELLRDNEPGSDKLKKLLDQRATQQLRLDSLVDDYATGLLDRAELSRAKTKAQAELSRINGEIELLGARKRQTGQLAVRESFRQTWEASEGIGWRGALIDMVVERIDVFPGIGKPFVNVDGIIMRFDKGRVVITWRKGESAAPSAA
jgi:DNA invertase Pin-like site-specific DNA recombinase